MTDSTRFATETVAGDGFQTVVASGELDVAAVPVLQNCISAVSGDSPVVLDLQAVTFMDSSGLGAVIARSREARESGERFGVVIGGSDRVRRIFELSALDGAVTVLERASDILETDA